MEPFAYDEYRKNKIKERLEKERTTRIQKKKLPKVNKQLAEKLIEGEGKRASVANPLGDDRFAAMFTNPDFTIDQESEVCICVCMLRSVLQMHYYTWLGPVTILCRMVCYFQTCFLI